MAIANKNITYNNEIILQQMTDYLLYENNKYAEDLQKKDSEVREITQIDIDVLKYIHTLIYKFILKYQKLNIFYKINRSICCCVS